MKRFLNFPNGVNSVNGVFKNYKINANAIAAGAYHEAPGDAMIKIPVTADKEVIIQLELDSSATDADYLAMAENINDALISNPGTPIIDLPRWFIVNVEVTNP